MDRRLASARFVAARLVAALALAVVAGCGSEDTGGTLDADGPVPLREGVTTVPPGGTVLTADLSGAEEVPGPGAPAATGTTSVVLTADGKVCVDLATSKLDAATAAHVHSGARGTAGPVVFALPTPAGGRASGCVNGDRAAVAKVIADPAGAYVNVHTAALPDGAIRGQLAKP